MLSAVRRLSSSAHNAAKSSSLSALSAGLQCRLLHSSPSILAGRKAGSSALDPDPRPRSMKQHKRQKRKIERFADVARHSAAAKEKRQPKMADVPAMESQIGEFFDTMTAAMDASLDQIMMPDSFAGLSLGEDEDGKAAKIKLNSKEMFEKLKLLDSRPVEAIVKNPVQLSGSDLLVLESGTSLSSSSSKSMVQCVGDGTTVLTAVEANSLLTIGSSMGKDRYESQGKRVLAFMVKHGLPVTLDAYNMVLFNLVRYRAFDECDRVFDLVIESDLIPDSGCWETHIYSRCLRGGRENIEKAIETIENLKKMSVPTTCKMFTAVLQQFVHEGLTEPAKDFWFNMHMQTDMPLGAEAFNTAIKMCVRGGEAERALFFYQEMLGCGVAPTVRTFEMLFRAVAKAPHWKRGYSDIIFEVMDYMEGKELIPDTRVYNAIINAFAFAGDPVAAEFYFWEMRRKGIAQDRMSYFNLFLALSKGQRVGDSAIRYGKRGRYSPPPEEEKAPMENAWAEVGATEVFRTMSKTYAAGQDGGNTVTGYKDRGSRQTDPYVAPDEGEDGGKAYEVEMQKTIMAMAREKRRKEGRGIDDLLYDFEIEELEARAEASEASAINMRKVLLIEEKLSAGSSYAEQQKVGELIEGLHEDELAVLYQRLAAAGAEGSEALLREVRGYSERPEEASAEDSPQYADGDASEFEDPFLKDLDKYLGEASFRDPEKAKKNALSNHQQQLLSLIDNEPFADEMSTKELDAVVHRSIAKQTSVDKQDDAWEMIEFGRAPHPDYSRPLSWRQQCNKNKADKLFVDLLRHSAGVASGPAVVHQIDVNVDMVNIYVSAHAEAGDLASARRAADKCRELNMRPDARTYELLVRAAVLSDDVDEADRVLAETKAAGLVPTRLAYGYVVHHYAAARNHTGAFRVLDEARQHGVTLIEKHYKTLRRYCTELGVAHPAIPEDPLQWAWDAKRVSKQLKRMPENRIHRLKSMTYY